MNDDAETLLSDALCEMDAQRAANDILRAALMAVRERFTVDAGEGRRFCWACRLYSEDVQFHTWRGPPAHAPACAIAGQALGGWKKQDQAETPEP
jgi:hypothetical protein